MKELAYVNGTVWQENASNLWWGKTSPTAAWGPGAGTATDPLPVSANDTVLLAGAATPIVDASGNQWTITGAGQVALNGVVNTTMMGVKELAYVNGAIWLENTANLWWGKTSATAAWGPAAGTSVSPLPSANDTVLLSGAATPIVDASGNQWTITSTGQVAVNGTADASTTGVKELAYVDGKVWQENTANLWWGKTTPTAAWGPDTGTSASPLPTSVTLAPTQASATVSLSQISVAATSGNHMLFITGSNDTVSLTGGNNTITDTGKNNTYVIPQAGRGYDTFTNAVLNSGATMDLRTALAATNWNGSAATLSKYLQVTSSAAGAVLSISPASGGPSLGIATIQGATVANFSQMLAHAIT